MGKSNEVVFNKEFECSKPCKYELGLLRKKNENDLPIYIKDEMGRNIKLETDDDEMILIRIEPYRKEELLFDLQTNERITFYEFLDKYLDRESINMVSGINHKIVVQRDDETYLFSLKTMEECKRFLDILTKYSIDNGLVNLAVKDINTMHRKYLYKIMEEKGYDKRILYKQSTNHPWSK